MLFTLVIGTFCEIFDGQAIWSPVLNGAPCCLIKIESLLSYKQIFMWRDFPAAVLQTHVPVCLPQPTLILSSRIYKGIEVAFSFCFFFTSVSHHSLYFILILLFLCGYFLHNEVCHYPFRSSLLGLGPDWHSRMRLRGTYLPLGARCC